MKSHFQMMAGYNGWANERLYAAAAALPDEAYRRECGAFFGSLHRTLNHILVGDRIWMRRFTGTGDAPAKLDVILYDDFSDLLEARRTEDARIADYVDSLSEEQTSGMFTYRTISNPTDITQPLAPALIHFFNHQTHHRGQAHCLLTQLSGTAPSFDLIVFQRETGIGLS
ncbi:DinB family protein [Microbaculum marinum]|uniref:DinB family protein n=1 Tax=Microbaculum marinum TaxID=1764581 RepID=A0AAW9RN46_9HYPH